MSHRDYKAVIRELARHRAALADLHQHLFATTVPVVYPKHVEFYNRTLMLHGIDPATLEVDE